MLPKTNITITKRLKLLELNMLKNKQKQAKTGNFSEPNYTNFK